MDSPKGRPKHRRRIPKVKRLFSSPELKLGTEVATGRLRVEGDSRILI